MNEEIMLGDEIQDRVTGIKGIATAKIIFLNGCVQYSIKPRADKDGKEITATFVDSQQIKRLGEGLNKKSRGRPQKKGKKKEPIGGVMKDTPVL